MRRLLAGPLAVAVAVSGAPARAGDKEACITASNRGQDQRAIGKLTEARAEFISCASESCPTVVRTYCAKWLEEVQASIPTIVLAAKNERGRDVVEAEVWTDGVRLARSIDGNAVPIDPGPHRLRFERPGGGAVELDVIVRAGEKNRTVAVVFHPPTERAEPPSRAGVPVASYILGVIGAVGLGSFAFFGLTGASQLRSLRDGCAPYCAHDDVVDVRTKFLVGDVSLGVGSSRSASPAGCSSVGRPLHPPVTNEGIRGRHHACQPERPCFFSSR
jgi:hypothetical protein